jgi:hypothetical protein
MATRRILLTLGSAPLSGRPAGMMVTVGRSPRNPAAPNILILSVTLNTALRDGLESKKIQRPDIMRVCGAGRGGGIR